MEGRPLNLRKKNGEENIQTRHFILGNEEPYWSQIFSDSTGQQTITSEFERVENTEHEKRETRHKIPGKVSALTIANFKDQIRQGEFEQTVMSLTDVNMIDITSGNYLNNEKHGVWRFQETKGGILVLEKVENYNRGVSHGVYEETAFADSGKTRTIKAKGVYKDGRKFGDWMDYEELKRGDLKLIRVTYDRLGRRGVSTPREENALLQIEWSGSGEN